MFESGSNLIRLHMQKVEFYPIHNSTDLIVFRILGLHCFHWIISRMRVRGWNLIMHIKLFMYFDVSGVDA